MSQIVHDSNDTYTVVLSDRPLDLIKEVNRLKKTGWITCGGLVYSYHACVWAQAMEIPPGYVIDFRPGTPV